MLIVGFLIAVAVAVFAGVVLSENWGGDTFTVNGFGHVLGHLTLGQIFISGIALTAVFFVGLWMASVSSRMRRRASGRRRAENRAIREEREELLADRDRLARELAAERDARTTQEVTADRVVNLDERPVEERPVAYPRGTEVFADQAAADEARRHTV
jgi:FtsZ-interacting cell division protein ZipA